MKNLNLKIFKQILFQNRKYDLSNPNQVSNTGNDETVTNMIVMSYGEDDKCDTD